MNKSVVYRRCEEFVKRLWQMGWTTDIPAHELRSLIEEHIGGDPRTVHLYLKRLVKFGFMESRGGRVYKIHHPDILKIVKGQKSLVHFALNENH
jgi:predicted transcriptional regulator